MSGPILLHSGGPLGPEGRHILANFLGSAGPIAFVTAANLYDEAAYFERVRSTLTAPRPEGAGSTWFISAGTPSRSRSWPERVDSSWAAATPTHF